MLAAVKKEDQQPLGYTRLQRRLHWLVIVLLVVQFGFQSQMRESMQAIEESRSLSFGQFLVSTAHTWGGLAIAGMMGWRWQLRRRKVPLNGGSLSVYWSKWVTLYHVLLYIVVLSMALSGAVQYYLGFTVAGLLHYWGKWLLLGLVGVHIAGALSHWRKDSTVLQHMMGRDSLR